MVLVSFGNLRYIPGRVCINVVFLGEREEIFMKKVSIVLLSLALLLSGCSSSEPTQETLDDGTEVTHYERGDNYTFESFPRDVVYNDTSFELSEVEFYEWSSDGYANNLFVVLYFDMNNMSDEDLYWFKNDEAEAISSSSVFELPLRADISIDSEQNGLDSESLSLAQNIYSSDNYKVLVYQLTGYRYSLAGDPFSLALYVKQGGTYEYTNDDGETSDLDKEDTYYYFGDIPSELDDLDVLRLNRESVYNAIFEQ